MITFIAVGDSFTEGVADDTRPDGHYRGWADRVADGLAQHLATRGESLRYADFAVRGKLLDQIVADQVPRALAQEPDWLTFHAGGNDALRPKTDVGELYRRYDAALDVLAASGATAIVFTSLPRAGGTGRLADAIAERFEAFNAHIRAAAAGRGLVVVDLERLSALNDRRFWHSDRLHLNAAGHARVAAAVLSAMGITDASVLGGAVGWWTQPLPPAAPASLRDSVAADARWVATALLPWVVRRVRGVSSGDGRLPKDPEPQPWPVPEP